ncbi:MAG: hypothetical protein AAFY80_10150 [Pseudomonadota bacterium]
MMNLFGATYAIWNLLKVWVGFAWYAAIGYTVYLAWNGHSPWWYVVVVWIAGWMLVLFSRAVERAAMTAAMRSAARFDKESE